MKIKNLILVLASSSLLMACSANTNNSSNSNSSSSSTTTTTENIQKAELGVNGKCDNCKTRIEQGASAIDGVKTATWDLSTKKLEISFDANKTSVKEISKVIAKLGHDTDLDKATDADYDALPGCCKYRG